MLSRITATVFLATVVIAAIYQASSLQPKDIELQPPNLLANERVLDAFSSVDEGPARNAAVAEALLSGRQTLFQTFTSPNLNLFLSGQKVVYSTNPEYFTAAPECRGTLGDIKVAAASAFGLRGYVFDDDQCVEFEAGHPSSAYYATAVDEEAGLLAFSIPGQSAIDIYSLADLKLVDAIRGYSATALAFHDGKLYFAGRVFGDPWNKASLFQFSLLPASFEAIYLRERLADSRGLAFGKGLVAVSSGATNEVLLTDHNFHLKKTFRGFNYPNGVSFTTTGNLLVADEHNGRILEVSPQTNEIIWASPAGELLSPGSAVEIDRGFNRGRLLIADADGNRVLLVDRSPWSVVFEASPVRSVMSAAPIYSKLQE